MKEPSRGRGRGGYMTCDFNILFNHTFKCWSRTKHVSHKQAPHCVPTINSACYQHQIQLQATSSASCFYNATVFTPVSRTVETKVQLTVKVHRLITRPPRVKCRNKAPKISFACQELKQQVQWQHTQGSTGTKIAFAITLRGSKQWSRQDRFSVQARAVTRDVSACGLRTKVRTEESIFWKNYWLSIQPRCLCPAGQDTPLCIKAHLNFSQLNWW